jgi:hypothetical protein
MILVWWGPTSMQRPRLSRSFPRKRESRTKSWVPAFAGTNGCFLDYTQLGMHLES